MDLILWRHAQASDALAGQNDADRALTSKGEQQARRMAQWLGAHLPGSVRVLVSPTLRTRQTAQALPRKFEIVGTLQPAGTVDALLHAARWPDARGAVLVVGHQPTLGLTAAQLLCGHAQPWTVRKGAIWWLQRRQRGSDAEVLLKTVLAPDQL